MIGTIINLITWILNLPFWAFVVIVIIIAILDIIVKFSDAGGDSNDYSRTDYSDSTYDEDFHMSERKPEHPFVFYDYMGNRCGRGSAFYDGKGELCSWGGGFHDGKGYYRNWGDGFYDGRGCYRSWGEWFYDAQGNPVYPEW